MIRKGFWSLESFMGDDGRDYHFRPSFRVLNHLLAGIHKDYASAILGGRQTSVVFIASHTFHLLELRGRYAAILQIILYGISAVLGNFHVVFVRADLVGMPYDGDVGGSIFLQNLGKVAQSFRVVAQRRGVEGKRIPSRTSP